MNSDVSSISEYVIRMRTTNKHRWCAEVAVHKGHPKKNEVAKSNKHTCDMYALACSLTAREQWACGKERLLRPSSRNAFCVSYTESTEIPEQAKGKQEATTGRQHGRLCTAERRGEGHRRSLVPDQLPEAPFVLVVGNLVLTLLAQVSSRHRYHSDERLSLTFLFTC